MAGGGGEKGKQIRHSAFTVSSNSFSLSLSSFPLLKVPLKDHLPSDLAALRCSDVIRNFADVLGEQNANISHGVLLARIYHSAWIFRKVSQEKPTTVADSRARTITTLFGCRLRHRSKNRCETPIATAVIKAAIDNYRRIINYSVLRDYLTKKRDGEDERERERERTSWTCIFSDRLSKIHLTVIRYRCIACVLICVN